MAPVYAAWQDLISDPALDRRFASEFIVEPLGVIITTTFFGTEDEWEESGIPDRIPTGGVVSAAVSDWLGGLAREAGNEALYIGDTPSPFYSKALGFSEEDLLSRESIDTLFQYIDDADKGTLIWFVIFDLTGGAINDVPLESTAYPHRDKLMFYQSYAIGLGALPDATTEFVEGVHKEIQKGAGPGANSTYAGYVDPALGAATEEVYWEGHADLLRVVKGEWDPEEVFWNPQAVRAP
ncbi:BBE domain-containing protein [Candidatus Bathyarchaeota archaeon]|nr:BBE domain-containing protein [Candidatus Bathyarchaeota archaeon]